ncbi:MAG TPA: hypothetical protein ENH67_05735 [Pseudoalteromonas sp.]|uniref:Sulfotransferase domain-containing protein n=1 Tax=marine sediment metagenome TaxID=412755 RepID=A0A0F9RXH5_9ZZZZ|nr:hypothetical protein [Pseudoalteromonas sp.]HDY92152.1 hypothetical protein [Pseudoalteromonas sp.]HDZ32371.1 hypothetical protein [Pseudoalteromonas sp.]
MSKVILHIGTEKTGTTSIQHLMSHNRQALLAKGVLYPNLGARKDAHFDLVNSVHPLDNGGRHMEFLGPVTQPSCFLWDKLEECINEHPNKTIVLSAEHFSSRLREKALKYINDFFNKLDIKPEIIIYLRPQADYIESSYSTEIKAGSPKVFKKVMEQYQSQAFRYDYKQLIDLWADFFSKDSIKIIPYEKSSIGDDIRLNFLSNIGVKDISGLNLSKAKLNEKWSNPMLEFARLANARMKDITGQERLNFFAFAQELIDTKLAIKHTQLMTEEQYKEVVSFYRVSNDALCKEYLPHRSDLFLDKLKTSPFRDSESTASLTHFDFMKIVYEIFKRNQK